MNLSTIRLTKGMRQVPKLIGFPNSDFYLFSRSVWRFVIAQPTRKSSCCRYWTALTSDSLMVSRWLTAYQIYRGAKEENLALFTTKWGLNLMHSCSTSLAMASPSRSQSNHSTSSSAVPAYSSKFYTILRLLNATSIITFSLNSILGSYEFQSFTSF